MKIGKLFGCMILMVAGSLAAAPHFTDTIHLADLNDRVIQDFSKGKLRDLVVECPEGTSLPFKMALKGQFLALEPADMAPMYLKVRKTCYVRCEEKDHFLFSTDLQTWKGFEEFFTGEVRVSVEAENGVPVAGLQVELNQR